MAKIVQLRVENEGVYTKTHWEAIDGKPDFPEPGEDTNDYTDEDKNKVMQINVDSIELKDRKTGVPFLIVVENGVLKAIKKEV